MEIVNSREEENGFAEGHVGERLQQVQGDRWWWQQTILSIDEEDRQETMGWDGDNSSKTLHAVSINCAAYKYTATPQELC